MSNLLFVAAIVVQAVLLFLQRQRIADLRDTIARQNTAMQDLMRADDALIAADDALRGEHIRLKRELDELSRLTRGPK